MVECSGATIDPVFYYGIGISCMLCFLYDIRWSMHLRISFPIFRYHKTTIRSALLWMDGDCEIMDDLLFSDSLSRHTACFGKTYVIFMVHPEIVYNMIFLEEIGYFCTFPNWFHSNSRGKNGLYLRHLVIFIIRLTDI